MILRHPGISPTNDLVAKKIFSNPEITCQFIRDMLDLPAKNVTILEGSNIHVLPSLPYSAQDFYTSIDVLAELDNGTQVIIEIQVLQFQTGESKKDLCLPTLYFAADKTLDFYLNLTVDGQLIDQAHILVETR